MNFFLTPNTSFLPTNMSFWVNLGYVPVDAVPGAPFLERGAARLGQVLVGLSQEGGDLKQQHARN